LLQLHIEVLRVTLSPKVHLCPSTDHEEGSTASAIAFCQIEVLLGMTHRLISDDPGIRRHDLSPLG
jgi:hypothetical protein